VRGGNGSLASTANSTDTGLGCSATFRFAVVPTPPAPPLPTTEFADCEAVACAGLATGEHNIRGTLRFCDNGMAGGGWLRLWRANDSRCEANSWTARRNPGALGLDPVGCRPTGPSCVAVQNSQAPFAFNEVRGGNWDIWAYGTPDGFNRAGALCDGIVVRDGSNELVWLFSVGLLEETQSYLRCPCESAFGNSTATAANLEVIGSRWTCDRAPARGSTWVRLFYSASTLLCAPNSLATAGDRLWFQRALAAPQRALSVAICKDGTSSDEDFKLASGDLFVRTTVGFDKTRSCPTTLATSASGASSTGSASMTSASTSAIITSATLLSTSALTSEETAVAPVAESTDIALIAGIVGGAFVFLALIVIAVAVFMRSRRKRAPSNELPMTTASVSNYGVAPPAKDEPPRRTSEYGPIVAGSEFDSARVESPYAASVADIMSQTQASHYGVFTPAERGPPE
jgi:hypothetical protein